MRTPIEEMNMAMLCFEVSKEDLALQLSAMSNDELLELMELTCAQIADYDFDAALLVQLAEGLMEEDSPDEPFDFDALMAKHHSTSKKDPA
jgi:hypothetical protein